MSDALEFEGWVYVSPTDRGITLLGDRDAGFEGAADLLATVQHVLIDDKMDGYAKARISVSLIPGGE